VFLIRRAELDDADALCDAHVASWRVAYRGLFPDSYLDADAFDADRRTFWRQARWLTATASAMLAAELDGSVLGFCSIGPEQIDGVPTGTGLGEVYSFYLHPHAWGSGLAAELMLHGEDHLRAFGFTDAVLWVLRDNPRARTFYEKAGWHWGGEEAMWAGPTMPGVTTPTPVAEVQYLRQL
jgi:GNAT superfamily N-acetyltransferase